MATETDINKNEPHKYEVDEETVLVVITIIVWIIVSVLLTALICRCK